MLAAEYMEVLNINDSRSAFLSPSSDGVKQARLKRVVNGECELKFILPRTSEKWAYIDGLHKIRVNGHIFWIVGTEEERDQQGRLLSNVQCEEIWVKDLGAKRANYLTVEILSSTAENALTTLLAGTGWSIGLVTVGTDLHDLETEKGTCLSNLKKVQELWGGILDFNSAEKKVNLFADADFGQNRGVQFRYGKNLKSISRKIDYNVITRLFPFGKDDLDISSVNEEHLYIDNFQYTTEVWEDNWVNQDYDDPAELKAKAIEYLDTISRPRANYAGEVDDLSSLTGYEVESFEYGDWITIFDPDIAPTGILNRIYQYEYDVFQPWDADVEFGDPQETLADILAGHQVAAEVVNNVVVKNPTLQNLFKGFVNTFTTLINSANGKLRWENGVLEAIEVDGSGNETGQRVRLTPGGLGISEDFGQTYVTAVTGQGILGDKVIANSAYVLRILTGGISIQDGLSDDQIAGAGTWNAAATIAANSVQKGVPYNSVSITPLDGILAALANGNYTRLSGLGLKHQIVLSATLASPGMTDSATTATLTSDVLLPAPFSLQIDNEIMIVRTKSGTSLSDILRGQSGSTATSHNAETPILLIKDYHFLTEISRVSTVGGGSHTSSPWWDESDVLSQVPIITIQLPEDFKEKIFKISVEPRMSDANMNYMFDGFTFAGSGSAYWQLRKVICEVVGTPDFVNATFQIKAYAQFRRGTSVTTTSYEGCSGIDVTYTVTA
ncbi:phage tail protein [Candidatus Formimonas warabiya]|uniref:Tail spike domain-containing protein n=1 Tax=Formimonas warabiya TaxID=1761012 RepID=A0A3G1KPW2_FORW1|nr:phage tail protein [Candidatus Formimonas warabiya]ATW24185.1 hypothetical protein DCMF_04745 [Candidatus Formimonas warabiya]